jgi:hypothetical protein
MRIISFDVGMKNLAYCIITIPDPPGVTSQAPSPSLPPSVTNFNQQSLDNLLQNLHIERWDVIDLRFEPTDAPLVAAEPAPKKTCDNDTKQAKFMFLPVMAGAATVTAHSHNNAKLYCLKCAEKSKYKIPSREILPLKRKPDLLSKKKLDELMDIRKQVVVTCDPGPASATTASTETTAGGVKLRKADLIQEIKTMLSRDYVEPFDEGKYLNYCGGGGMAAAPTTGTGTGTGTGFKKPNYTYAHDLDLITYGRNLMKHLDILLSSIDGPIDMMIVENQISTLASRMKTLQGMITQYFIMKDVPEIEFISASCKLKLFTDSALDISSFVDASTYSDRKKSGISICRSLGTGHNTPYATWMPMFEKHKKKDDLADCFLQGLWRVYLLTAQ